MIIILKVVNYNYQTYINNDSYDEEDKLNILGKRYIFAQNKCLDEIIENLNFSYSNHKKDFFFNALHILHDYIAFAFYSKQYPIEKIYYFESNFYNDEKIGKALINIDNLHDLYYSVLRELNY